MRFRTFVLLTLVTGMMIPGTGKAITDEAIFRNFRFNFINPGGRTLGLAGAFIAAADDATAVQANPAALHYIQKSEFFIEFRSLEIDDQISTSRSGNVDLMNEDLPFLSVTEVSNPEDISNASFISYAHSWRLGSGDRRLSLAFSRQILLEQKTSLSVGGDGSRAEFATSAFPVIVGDGGLERYSVTLVETGGSDTEIIYWNAGGSLQVHNDFSVGLTLSLATLEIQADSQGVLTDPLEQVLPPTNPRLPPTLNADIFRNIIDDTDSDLAYTIGLHWHPDSVFYGGISPWQFGAVLRKGAKFSFQEDRFRDAILEERAPVTLKVPDRYGVGVSYKPLSSPWVFTMDYERVEYSDLLEGFESGVNLLTNEDVTENILNPNETRDPEYDVDDADIFRFGVERLFSVGGGALTLRGGYFNSPDNKIAMTSFSTDARENSVYLDAFSGGEDENHYTAGVSYGKKHSVVDIGADFSSDSQQIVVSYIYRR